MEDKEVSPEATAQVHLIIDQKTRIKTAEITTDMMTSQTNNLEIKIFQIETQEILKMKVMDRARTQARTTEEILKPETRDLEADTQVIYFLQIVKKIEEITETMTIGHPVARISP